ncbi:hypothetical protein PTTG_10786 [Puccinia triticina 1-1 BBBD Race 1]|uniref:Uncharacterized protein n=1 Tax=Puccinia triticina (isolate 1-1 / race 1 (BBBD)) TaxID=630390 RepID=A0A0C4FC34_PUCT1|nr:hypothetical protein PTTG_10786 [Puccinia triticina 1-1 BBBD Race 1]
MSFSLHKTHISLTADLTALQQVIAKNLRDQFPNAPPNEVFVFPTTAQDLLGQILPHALISAQKRRELLAKLFIMAHELAKTLQRAIYVPQDDLTAPVRKEMDHKIGDEQPQTLTQHKSSTSPSARPSS